MMTRPDLHMHTSFSDGVLTPAQLVEKAAALGVTVMAVTDHDTFRGADSLQGMQLPIPVIPGIELSLRGMRNLHLLGYGTGEARELRTTVAGLARKRESRAGRMLEKLEAMGMPLRTDSLAHEGTVGRMHIARAMMAAGYVATAQEAFDRYLGEGCPAYVPGERLSMEEALPLMRRSGFVPVLAHPALLGLDDMALRPLLQSWQRQGLMGVEVYHPSRAGRGFDALARMARRMGLLVTGGSDFHQEGDSHGLPGCTADSWIAADRDVQGLLEAMNG
ncbi:MAG: PHP domain-containing protein [Aristaeellaceae bacterium]